MHFARKRFNIIDLTIDAMDASGEHQLGVEHTLFKVRLNSQGQPIEAEKLGKFSTLFVLEMLQK